MTPIIKTLIPKKFIGHSLKMSVTDNKTGQLWGGFAPLIKNISNRVNNEKISMQIYPDDYYKNFSPNIEFEKWAAVEVKDYNSIPEGMKSFNLERGLYAVFHYKGSSSDPSIFQYIFNDWIPNSNYSVDNRPHFEVLGENYRNNDPNSEEEIWIPIKEKKRK